MKLDELRRMMEQHLPYVSDIRVGSGAPSCRAESHLMSGEDLMRMIKVCETAKAHADAGWLSLPGSIDQETAEPLRAALKALEDA